MYWKVAMRCQSLLFLQAKQAQLPQLFLHIVKQYVYKNRDVLLWIFLNKKSTPWLCKLRWLKVKRTVLIHTPGSVTNEYTGILYLLKKKSKSIKKGKGKQKQKQKPTNRMYLERYWSDVDFWRQCPYYLYLLKAPFSGPSKMIVKIVVILSKQVLILNLDH